MNFEGGYGLYGAMDKSLLPVVFLQVVQLKSFFVLLFCLSFSLNVKQHIIYLISD